MGLTAVVNFRFHIVSLVAVFLALGVGVVMGSTVIDQATIDFLRRNQDILEGRIAGRDTRIVELSDRLERWDAFAEQARPELLAGRLAGVPVLVVGVEGTDSALVDALHEWLGRAGAADQGTLVLTARFALAGEDDAAALAAAAGVGGRRPEAVRAAALARLAGSLARSGMPPPSSPPAAPPAPDPLLPALVEAGFARHQPVAGGPDLAALPLPDTRLVVVSGPGARLAAQEVAVPLLRDLAGVVTAAVVVAEPGGDDPPAGAGGLVAAVRRDGALAERVSTVDNLASFMGQVAAVLAIEDLASATRGHYGVGPGADSLLPPPNAA